MELIWSIDLARALDLVVLDNELSYDWLIASDWEDLTELLIDEVSEKLSLMDLLQVLRIAIADVLVVTEVDQVVSIDDTNDSSLS